MRKIIVSEFISLDGVVEDPGGAEKFEHGGWTWPYWNDELGIFKQTEMLASDALLLGRVTYEGFAKAWPERKDDPGANFMNNIAKYVVSQSLQQLDWSNSHLFRTNVTEEITKLKNQPGKDILIYGSATLVQSLMNMDLIDEYNLLVYPIVLGKGKRLFDGVEKAPLKLVETKSYSTGVILQRYEAVRI